LVTSIEVYTKYLLRSDLEALQEAGRIDLEELGLTTQADQEEGTVFTNVLKSIAVRFRSEPSHHEIPVEEANGIAKNED